MSADNEAVRGYSKILKIYEFTADNMSFDYNSGFDFTKSTIDRKLEGVAKANDKKQYIFEEHTSGHKYKLVFEFNDAMNLVKIFQYDNDNEMGYFTLWR